MKAVLCPVCMGEGKLTDQPAASTGDNLKTCQGCGGKGWVTVPETEREFVTTPAYPETIYNLKYTWNPPVGTGTPLPNNDIVISS